MSGVYETLSSLVRTRVQDTVEDVIPIGVHYPNESQRRPETGRWVSVSVDHSETEPISAGSIYRIRMAGTLDCTVWDSINAGDGGARRDAKVIQDAFRGVTSNGVHYEAPSVAPKRGGPRMGGQYGLAVRIPFHMDVQPSSVSTSDTSTDPFDAASVGSSLRSWFKARITSARSVLTMFDNAPFTPPYKIRWCRFSIIEGDPSPSGNGRYRTPGIATAQVFIPIGSGTKQGLEVVDWVADTFRNTRVGGVTFHTPSLRTVGSERDGRFWHLNLSCPFSYEFV